MRFQEHRLHSPYDESLATGFGLSRVYIGQFCSNPYRLNPSVALETVLSGYYEGNALLANRHPT